MAEVSVRDPVWRAAPGDPKASGSASTAQSSPATPRSFTLALSGAALFGFALRSAVQHAVPNFGHLGWAVGLTFALLGAWLVILPGIYVYLGARHSTLRIRDCLAAALESFRISAVCLASSAAVLWFFAVTAPKSVIVAPLGTIFTGFAAIAGAAAFSSRLESIGVRFNPIYQLPLTAMTLAIFIHFSNSIGIHWS